MGLDCIWYDPKTNEKMYLEFDPELNLVGGLFSEFGNGSFRGRYYADFFMEVIGVNLYETLDNERVREVAQKLNAMEYSPRFKEYGVSQAHFEDLKRMFTAYGEAGAILEPWY